jgi:hypothetical protein
MKEIIRMNQLAGLITEGQARKMMQLLNENKALGNIFYEEDGEYFYDDAKLIELIKNMGYEDAEEIAKEITTVSSPEDELEFLQNKYNKPDLKIEDITLDMIKKGIEDVFEKL